MIELDRWADTVAAWRSVKIDAARCLPQISPRCRCDDCARVCPEESITLGQSPTVRDCSGCGLCAASCTADAIVLDDPSDEQLVQRFAALGRKEESLSLTCMVGPAGPEQVGCLGRLTPELLLAAAACGFTTIDLVTGACAECRYRKGQRMTEEAVAAARAILLHLGHTCQLRLVDASAWGPVQAKKTRTAVQAPVYTERRAFLLSVLGLLPELLPLTPERAAKNQPAALQFSRRREILRWALAQMGVDEGAAASWGQAGLRLTGRCVHCGICQRLCPNGAITVAAATGLQLDPRRCHTCGLCTQVCPTSALSLGTPYGVGEIASGAPLVLGQRIDYRCVRCGEPVMATGDGAPYCLPCSLRPQHQEVIAL